jgi:uncharacterized iron-regulated membrane protein
MKNPFRLSLTWLHTWSGLLVGWILFAVFVTGTATYFRHEITRWMQPELRGGASPIDAARAAVARLETVAADSDNWFINLPDARDPSTVIFWREPGQRRFGTETLDPRTGEKLTARDTRGGEFFYRFHFQFMLPHPWGRYLAGVAAMFMFVALISGIVAHRRFFKDFFTFRNGLGSLRTWLDFHNVTAVLALPFYLVISYSALVIFMSMYMPWGDRALSDGARPPPRHAAPQGANEKAEAKPWTATAPVGPMLDEAVRRWGENGRTLQRLSFSGRGTGNATATLIRADGEHISTTHRDQLRFNAVTGEFLPGEEARAGPAAAIHGTLYGLHLAHFAGPVLRWLFFLMGTLGGALVATGLVLWTVKRRPRQEAGKRLSFGHGLVERLNIAAIAGLPVAIAVFFWANRLLPSGLGARAGIEERCFLIAWAVMLLHPLVRPVMRAWREQLWLGAALHLALPFLDLFTGPWLKAAFARGDPAYLGFHAVIVFVGLMLAVAARKAGRPRPPKPGIASAYAHQAAAGAPSIPP